MVIIVLKRGQIKVGQFKDGLDMSAIREVKFLRELQHPNIINLLDVFTSKANLNLVLEYLDSDLEAAIRDKTLTFSSADVKSWMLMMLKGLDHCHRNWILHRVRVRSLSDVQAGTGTGHEAEQSAHRR